MKKWYDEEYEFTVEVTGFLHGDHTERYCRNGEEVGDRYSCTYGCPVNQDGYGICSKTMMMLYPLMEAVRSGGDLTKVGGDEKLGRCGQQREDEKGRKQYFFHDLEKKKSGGCSPLTILFN